MSRQFLLIGALLLMMQATAQETYTRTLKLMGSRFDITVVADSPTQGNQYIDLAVKEIGRIECLISEWDPASETSEINRNAGICPVQVDAELFGLIERSLAISKLTDGAFDISYASMDKVWKFDGSMKAMPSPEAIQVSVAKVGYRNIVLDKNRSTVFLKLPGMKIGFGAIGKGYAADKGKALLMEKGVSGGIVNASGDMNTWGKQPDGKDWEIGITNPLDKNKVFGVFPLKQGAVVTSGTYEKYVTFNGKRYSHIIDPRTGYPTTGIISATVFAPKAELADALATSVFVMGIDVGLDRLGQLPGVECIIIDESGRIHLTKNIRIQKN
ncbi:MAG: FAD:protein FMN transferase [Mangrovibacterium sp.]